MPITRADVDALLSDPAAYELTVARDAISRLDAEHALRVFFARAKRREPVPIEIFADLLPWLDSVLHFAMVVAIGEGDRAEALLSLLDRNAFAEGDHAQVLRAAAIYLAWTSSSVEAQRNRLLAHARLALHDHALVQTRLPRWLLRPIGAATTDPVLDAQLAALSFEGSAPMEAAMVLGSPGIERARMLDISDSFEDAEMPRAIRARLIADLPRNVGRNAPCPCGSGLKFKRCHGDLDSGVSWAAPVPPANTQARVPRTAEDVYRLPLHVLPALQLPELDTVPLHALMLRLAKHRVWVLAESALHELCQREIHEQRRHEYRSHLAVEALRASSFELVGRCVAPLSDDSLEGTKPAMLAAVAVGARSTATPNPLGPLVAALTRAVVDNTGGVMSTLAESLRDVMPPLSIVLTRACAATHDATRTGRLLASVDRARIQIGLQPGDPVRSLFEAVSRVESADLERDRLVAVARTETDGVRRALADVQRVARERDQTIADLSTQLGEARTASARIVDAPPDPAEIRALRAKIDDLHAAIRTRNIELSILRRRTSDSSEPIELEPAQNDDTDVDADMDDAPLAERRILIPIWSDQAQSNLREVPVHVAREALRTIAELASGEWRQVKRPRGTRASIWMTRVGIHHRMLFAADAQFINVLELVSRESLYRVLKRY